MVPFTVYSCIGIIRLWDSKHHFLIFRFYDLTSPLHLLTLYRAFVAAGAAYESFNLSDLHYILYSATILRLNQVVLSQMSDIITKKSYDLS